MDETFRVEEASNGRFLEARVFSIGGDLLIIITGGERPHIGSVVLARPGLRGQPLLSAMTIVPHKEEDVARDIARAVCDTTGRVSVVSAGIHENELDADGIRDYLRLAGRMREMLVAELGNFNGCA